MLKACKQEQPLALDLPVVSALNFFPAHSQPPLVPLVGLELLACVEAPRHALPENDPLDLALHILLEAEPFVIDLPRARDPPVIQDNPEAGAQAEAEQVEPARLVVAPLPSAVR